MSTARRTNAIVGDVQQPRSRIPTLSRRWSGRSHAKRASGQPVAVGGEDDRGRVQLLLPIRDGLEPLEDRRDGVRGPGAPRTSSLMLSALQVQRQQALPGTGEQIQRSGRGFPAGAHSRFPGHALTPTGVMAIRCKQFHLPDL